MSVINTNISSMQAQSSVRTSGLNLSTAMERLSSGVRINSAKDDAAGLAISTRMTASIRGISAAIRNANDGISLTQTAEGSLAQIGDNLQRIRELAVQSANTGNNASDRAAMNNEAKQLIAEIDRVASNTKYNGIALLDGSFRGQDLQVGAGNGTNDRIAISIGSAKSSTLGVGGNSSYAASKVGSSVGATALADSALNINGFSTSAAISDGVSSTLADTSGIAVAAAINAISARSNVTATVGETSVVGTAATGFATAIAAGDVKINGVSIGPIAAASTAGGRGNQVAAAVNAVSSSTGVTATFDSTTGAVSLNAADGRNITIDAVNAGGNSAVTGLGLGTTSTMAAASAAGNTAAISNLKINGVAIADVGGISATTTPGAAAVTVAATTAGVGSTQAQVSTATFAALSFGQSVTFGGLTFTGGTAGATQDQVKAAFAAIAGSSATTAQTFANANTTAGATVVNDTIGKFTSGTAITGGTFAAGGGAGQVTWTAASGSDTQITLASTGSVESSVVTFSALKTGQSFNLNGLGFTAKKDLTSAEVASAFGSLTSIAPTSTFALGGTGARSTETVAFKALNAGQSATVNGLTFTAKSNLTDAQVAAAFASALTGETAAQVTDRLKTSSALLGTYTGTNTAGYASTTVSNTNQVVYTSVDNAAASFGTPTGTPANTANGDYTGSWTAGYSTAAASGATVTATATAAGTADIAFSSSKFTDLVSSINAKTAETGVTATLASAGKVSLVSTKDIVLSGAAATSAEITALTGISGTAVASTAANTSTMRSAVTLSSTNAAGINLSGTTAAALAASGLTEESVVAKTTAGAGISSLDLTTASGSQAALTTLDSAINTITDSRAAMGAYQNRLTASISNLETTSMNLSASRSRILDTDYAKETTNLAKSQIIQQAATAMLAQANQSGQSVLALLK